MVSGSAATALLLRGLPLLRSSSSSSSSSSSRSATAAFAAIVASALSRRHLSGFSSADDPIKLPENSVKLADVGGEEKEFKRWKVKEAEILMDVEPVVMLAKEILHSNRYKDGQKLNEMDEELIVEKLLAFHPRYEDKIGCGLEAIMVDKHPQFTRTRCLFVVRIDGGWIDFSYQKCLLAYIRKKYPSHADRFIKEHFKRSLK